MEMNKTFLILVAIAITLIIGILILPIPKAPESVTEVLADDDTDTAQFGVMGCADYAVQLQRRATEAGFDCRLVFLYYGDISHCIVAFNTEEGLIYIEPQNDREMVVQINTDYILTNYRYEGYGTLYKILVTR